MDNVGFKPTVPGNDSPSSNQTAQEQSTQESANGSEQKASTTNQDEPIADSKYAVKIRPAALPITPQVETSIETDCSMNGYGKVTCNFRNAGSEKDSVCVQAVLLFKEGSVGYKMLDDIKNDKIKYDQQVELMTIGKSRICSGLVEPRDVRQMEQNAGFAVEPFKVCNTVVSSSWSTGCFLEFIPISQ